jgi:hypothetical protein
MQELLNQLTGKAGLSEEQAQQSVAIMKEFVLSKVPPMFSAVVEGFFAEEKTQGHEDGLV